MQKVYRGALIGLEGEYCLNSGALDRISQNISVSGAIALSMPRTFRSGKQFWVLFGLMAISFRILTGAPEAQVNFTSLFVDQQLHEVNHHSDFKELYQSSLLNNADANSIPEKHHTYSTYKKYISPDNHFANLAHSVQYSVPVVTKIDFAAWVAKETQKINPNSHSPPAVVSAHSLTYTTTTGNSVVTENNFGEGKNTYSGEFGSFTLWN